MEQRWECINICQTCGKLAGNGKAKGLCKKCYHKKYLAEHHEKALQYGRAYYYKDPKKFNERAKRRKNIEKRFING